METIILIDEQPEIVVAGDSQIETPQLQYKWSCDACGGTSDTGCLSSTGECYR